MVPIVVSTIGSKSLPVLQASIQAYCPDVELIVHQGSLGNFGLDYNVAMTEAFKTHDEIIIANDDVVLGPHTLSFFLDELDIVKTHVEKPGLIATLSDFVRPIQNVRSNPGTQILQAPAISPIFAWISKEAFEASGGFPPLNWYSDDVICYDLSKLGYSHFVTRSYVHHAGSTTIGHDEEALTNDAKPWIIENRPEYAKAWFGV